MLAETPDIKRLEDSIERRRRVVKLEKSLRIPDLAIGVGRAASRRLDSRHGWRASA